jgi:hypothetical protein
MHDGPALLSEKGKAGAIMRTRILKYAAGAALSAMLTLGAAAGLAQIGSGARAANQVAQFCVPAHDDNTDVNRLYCRNEDGWSGPTGAAAFACFMQGIEQRTSPLAIDSLRSCTIAIAAADRMH